MDNKVWNYKQITLEDMMKYIETNAPKDKEWFKSIALSEEGKYLHLTAKKAFCEKYMPEIIPQKKETTKKSDLLLNW